MSLWMLLAQRLLLRPRERYALPPEQITEHAAEAVGLDGVAHDKPKRKAASIVNHFAYGAAAGALYAPLRPLAAPALLKGVLFGSLVWSGSYLGLLPVLGLLSSATEHPARRNVLMIVAHLIWGGVLSVLVEANTRKNVRR
ncbi:DUF1440 domain-containing protein [Deinococcus peraridilitoris]|nr:DUF1440 domain-containing protein [Deinococcus peraridilitoris]